MGADFDDGDRVALACVSSLATEPDHDAELNSGIISYDSPSCQKIEGYARIAYTLARASTRKPQGTGRLLEALLACDGLDNGYRIELVEVGIAPGMAELEFSNGHEPNSHCTIARIADHQSNEDMVMACARACALFVAWVRGEEWHDRLVDAVALAIAMPEQAFREKMDAMPVEALAATYLVDRSAAQQRLAMFRAQRGSGERAAIASLVT